jgi:hypothetical protein
MSALRLVVSFLATWEPFSATPVICINIHYYITRHLYYWTVVDINTHASLRVFINVCRSGSLILN